MDNSTKNHFNVSQEYEIVQHQKGKAYPISVIEWNFIKNKICEIKIDINHFHTIGYLLLGASASCIITIFATEFKTKTSEVITWGIFGVTLISGLLSIFFAKEKHKNESAKPNEVINQMNLIESRFENRQDQ